MSQARVVVVCWECGAFFDGEATPPIRWPGEGLRRLCPACYQRTLGRKLSRVWMKSQAWREERESKHG